MFELGEELLKLQSAGSSYVLITLVQIRGSAPQVVGAKMLVTEAGLHWGTVGGGKIEAHVILTAQAMLNKKAPSEFKTWNLQSDIGMSCGGEVSLFFDVQTQDKWPIVIFGAGHISQQLCKILTSWSCQITVFDSRPEWLGKLPIASNLKRQRSEDLAKEASNLPPNSFVLCMTQGHSTDFPILLEVFRAKAKDQRSDLVQYKFVGVIGSEVKALKIKKELQQAGISEQQLKNLHCPLGFPIGNNTPSEIAVSIAAQLLAVRDQSHFEIKNGLEV